MVLNFRQKIRQPFRGDGRPDMILPILFVQFGCGYQEFAFGMALKEAIIGGGDALHPLVMHIGIDMADIKRIVPDGNLGPDDICGIEQRMPVHEVLKVNALIAIPTSRAIAWMDFPCVANS